MNATRPRLWLIAEDVAQINPDLVTRNERQPESVRYEQINAMLLNEFLKEHKAFVEEKRKVQRLEANCRESRGNGQKAGGANPNGEHTRGREQIGVASGSG